MIVLKAVLPTILIATMSLSCSAVRIESGTPAEKAEYNEGYASDIRAEFAQQINSVEPEGQLNYLLDYAEYVSENLLKFGSDMAREWYEGEEGRGEVIPDSEMREMIDRSIDSEKPILRAWEDNLEYGNRILYDGGYFTETIMAAVQGMIDAYYELNSAVMFPNGGPGDYEDDIDAARRDFERYVRDIRRDAGLY